jgi:hypothetical protein
MTEIELLQHEFDAVPAPEERTVMAARAALLRDIAAESQPSRVWTRRGWIRLAVATGALALFAGVLTAVIPHSDRLTGSEIAAAAYRALTPVDGRIWHRVTRTTRTTLGGVERQAEVWERWVATSPPYGLRDRSPRWGETEIGPCGSIQYIARDNVFRVSRNRLALDDPRPYDVAINGATDPARQYRHLFRSGRVRYRGETTFQGIAAAYRLVVGGPESSVSYLVRQDNFYPLRTIRRTQTYIEVVTFLKFEYIPRKHALPGCYTSGGTRERPCIRAVPDRAGPAVGLGPSSRWSGARAALRAPRRSGRLLS